MVSETQARGYRFFFFSNEGDPLEPLHIHVQNGEKQAKIVRMWHDDHPPPHIHVEYQGFVLGLRDLGI